MRKETFEDIYNQGFVDALNTMEDFYDVAYDVMDDYLEDECGSVTEKALAEHFISKFLDTVHDLMVEEFCVEELPDEDVCDGNCADCILVDEEIN